MQIQQRALNTCVLSSTAAFFPLFLCPGHGSGVERWTEEDCAHLPSSHCRQECVNTNYKQQKKFYHINSVLKFSFFLSGTIEERIFQRQVSKQGLSGTVVDMGKGAEHTSFSTSDLRDLFSLTETPCLTHDLLNCGCSMDGTLSGRLTYTPHMLTPEHEKTENHASSHLCGLHFQLSQRKRSRFPRGPASSVVKVTVRGRHRSISACPSSCSGDISPVTHTPSPTPTSITHETTSLSPSRPPSLTQPSKQPTLVTHTRIAFCTNLFGSSGLCQPRFNVRITVHVMLFPVVLKLLCS